MNVLHHGMCSEEFSPRFVGTDYFTFYHKPCIQKEWCGHSLIIAVLIDNDGRIIFNLKCRDCGAIDALKTHPLLWVANRPKPFPHDKVFMFSPHLKKCVKYHLWDNK